MHRALSLLIALAVVLPAIASAQPIVPIGPATLTHAGFNGALNDIAFNDKRRVYLQVWGHPVIMGRFINEQGAAIGPGFVIAASGVSDSFPTVAYSAGSDDDVFFVLFTSELANGRQMYMRLVQYSDAGPVMPPARVVSSVRNAIQKSGSIAYNPFKRQFLPTWEGTPLGNYEVFAQLWQLSGTAGSPTIEPASAIVNVSSAPFSQGQPNVAYDWKHDKYFVVYALEHPTTDLVRGSWGKLLSFNAANEPALSGLITLSSGSAEPLEQNVIYMPEADRFLTFWTDFGRGRDLMGRIVDHDGNMTSGIFPIIAAGSNEGAADAAYNPFTRNILVTSMRDALRAVQGIQLTATGGFGNFDPFFTASTAIPPAGALESHFPHVAIGRDGRFGLSYANPFAFMYFDVLQGTVVPGGEFGGAGPNGPPSAPPSGPTMAINKSSLRFAASTSGSGFVTQTGNQTLRITQSGEGTVTWTASANQPWLTVSPTSGTGPATLTVAVTAASNVPPTGTSNGSVALSFTGAGVTPGAVSVTLATMAHGGSTPPAGAFDTPLHGASGLTGSVAVTGWAIDDVEVARVRIYREAVAGEGSGIVFLGTATFVDGARPDVAAVTTNRPMNTRAGWGYLLLSNFLPNGGNGTFTLHAFAEDVEGQSAHLGFKTITVANSSATTPFGTIDTPGQGETIGGTNYSNYGWVLGNGYRADPAGGGSVTVLIDGVAVGMPAHWTSRADLNSLFAGRPGLGTAFGVFNFNPSAYADGVHTIAWVVTDSNGGSAGVGSRYFNVASGNPSGLAPVLQTTSTSLTMGSPELMLPQGAMNSRGSERLPVSLHNAVASAPSVGGIEGRHGYDETTPFQALVSDGASPAILEGEELDRFEILLGRGVPASEYTGYMRVGRQLGPLPIGSRLDATTFTWQAGVGFVGEYDLVFVRWSGDRAVARHDVRILLHPKGSNRVGAQVVIDTPVPNFAVSGPFVIAGWAIDLDDVAETGVSTLHVWAYPTTGESPIFLGATSYGGDRPDVAAVFGQRFRRSGYGLTVDNLIPGTYDLAVFAWSSVRNTFVPAKLVRVTVR